ncbi:hypothetical protein HY468_03495 [Candidatus Roizmanbacteria bacterium]|nr:hypothetical protein [Candidatus Roizmanbacteria bacterium]
MLGIFTKDRALFLNIIIAGVQICLVFATLAIIAASRKEELPSSSIQFSDLLVRPYQGDTSFASMYPGVSEGFRIQEHAAKEIIGTVFSIVVTDAVYRLKEDSGEFVTMVISKDTAIVYSKLEQTTITLGGKLRISYRYSRQDVIYPDQISIVAY